MHQWQLQAHAGRPLLMGSFSAASNVTGVLAEAALTHYNLNPGTALTLV